MMAYQDWHNRLRAIVGDDGVILDDAAMAPYIESWRDDWRGKARAVARPRITGEVADIVKLCRETGTPIVPQGGRTGVTGAGQPHSDGDELVLSLERMDAIRDVDTVGNTILVEAGCILGDVRVAAESAGRMFPLYFGSVGSCRIGGNIATNAGGINVIRYGSARNLVLGLEVVLVNGEIWNGLRRLRKDNAGYDLKHLFIGSEGTLGIITAAVLRLFPRPRASVTAFLALPSPEHAVRLLGRARDVFAEQITAFELIGASCMEVTLRRIPDLVNPICSPAPWYVLMEVSGQEEENLLLERLEQTFQSALDAAEITDGVVASSIQQAQNLWRLRESIPEAHKAEGRSFKHDISLPISHIPAFLASAEYELTAAFPGIRMFTFGHLGDGNLHFNPLMPSIVARPDDLSRANRIVHDIVAHYQGSISAEHGVGQLRVHELQRYRSPVELEMMRVLKAAFDPQSLLNPGKVLERRVT